MSTFTERIHALVIERAQLHAEYEFPELRSTDGERAARQARNEARAARIAETYAEAQQIIIEQLGNEARRNTISGYLEDKHEQEARPHQMRR